MKSSYDTVNTSFSDAWYSIDGSDNDVVLSTRVRLARNLVNFPFPSAYKGDDAERVRALIFDSFVHMENPEHYQLVCVHNLENLGQRILIERGVIVSDIVSSPSPGVVVRLDGKVSCTVNNIDHLRISSFVSGLDVTHGFNLAHNLDLAMQNRLQFASSVDFGYLTTQFSDTGSGMKISLMLHLPSITHTGILQRVFKDVLAQGFIISGFYGTGSDSGSSLGSYYQLSNSSSFFGSEEGQIESITSIAKNICETERKIRLELADNKPTVVRDLVFRAIALIKYCRFLNYREGIDALSKIKWGLNMKLISGITDTELFSLLYRIQTAHLQYVIRSSDLNFEVDVDTDELKIDRLRSLIIQESLSKIEILC